MSDYFDEYISALEDRNDQRDKYNDLLNFLARLETTVFLKLHDIEAAERIRDLIKDKLNEHDIYEW